MPINPTAAKAIKLNEAENIAVPIRNCAEKNTDKAPEQNNRTIKYLRIEDSISKI